MNYFYVMLYYQVTFRVDYYMSLDEYETGTAIAVGVLAGLSLLYAGLKTWSWSKRTGRITVDFMTLIKFLLLSCGYVANSLFVVALGAAIFWWILYKVGLLRSYIKSCLILRSQDLRALFE